MINEKKIFSGGINDDDDWKLVPDGDYLSLENGIISYSEDGKNLRVENIYGNDLVGKITRANMTITTFVGTTPTTPGNFAKIVFTGNFVNGDVIPNLQIVRQLPGGGGMSLFFTAVTFIPGDTAATFFARLIAVINNNVFCRLYGISAFILGTGDGIQINTAFNTNTDFITVSGSLVYTQNDAILPNGINITHGSCVDVKRKRILYANWNSLGEHGIYCYDIQLDKIYTVLLSSNLNVSRVTCTPTFLGGGSSFGTTAQYVYSGVAITGDQLQVSVQQVGGGPNFFGVTVTVRYGETLAQALVRLATLFNANAIAIANNLTCNASSNILFFDFNGVQYFGGNIITLVPFVPSSFVLDRYSRIDRNMKVIDDLLYFVDDYNELFKINIERGIKTNNGGYISTVSPYILPIDNTQLTWIKKPPVEVLNAVKIFDNTLNNNFIYRNAYFFTYRYTYFDNENSVLASYTNLFHPNIYNINSSNLMGANENWNGFALSLPLTELIHDDVRTISFYAKYGNSGKTILIKRFDKSNPAQNQVILDHNNGVAALLFSWYGDTGVTALSDTEANKDFNGVPRKAKTFDIAKNRNFIANFLSGYDSPKITSLGFSLASQTIPLTGSYSAFKFESKFSIGVTFYDKYKRKCGVVTNENLTVKVPSQNVATARDYYWLLQWTLSNTNALSEIPSWAYYYSIDKTDDLFHQDFICARARTATNNLFPVRYIKEKNSTGYVYVDGVYDANYYGIAILLDELNANGLGYNYQEGDVVNLMYANYNTNSFFSDRGNVLGVDGNYLICTLMYGDISNQSTNTNKYYVFSISTPKKGNVNEPFYTTGKLYKINNPTLSNRSYSTLLDYLYGDVFVYSCEGKFAINIKNRNMLEINKWNKNLGFVNVEDEIGEQRLETNIAYTNTFIQGSKVNGLNEVEALSRKEIGGESGAIQKLQITSKRQEDGNVLLAVCESKTLSIYLGEVQLKNANETSNLIVSDGVIGSINTLKLNVGTRNPESVIEKDGEVYWVDLDNECYVQYAQNGLVCISNNKISRFLKQFSKAYKTLGKTGVESLNGFSHICTLVDQYRNEILFTIPKTKNTIDVANWVTFPIVPGYAYDNKSKVNLYEGLGKTIGFTVPKGRFESVYNYVAEWSDYFDNTLYSFKQGKLYKHGLGAAYNSFYGVQSPTRLMFSLNTAPSAVKDIYNISVEGSHNPNFTLLYANYPFIQITDLAGADVDVDGVEVWKFDEGVWKASFMKDRLSPNVANNDVFVKMLEGDFIKTAAPFIMVEFPVYTEKLFINFINVGFGISRNHLKTLK